MPQTGIWPLQRFIFTRIAALTDFYMPCRVLSHAVSSQLLVRTNAFLRVAVQSTTKIVRKEYFGHLGKRKPIVTYPRKRDNSKCFSLLRKFWDLDTDTESDVVHCFVSRKVTNDSVHDSYVPRT